MMCLPQYRLGKLVKDENPIQVLAHPVDTLEVLGSAKDFLPFSDSAQDGCYRRGSAHQRDSNGKGFFTDAGATRPSVTTDKTNVSCLDFSKIVS